MSADWSGECPNCLRLLNEHDKLMSESYAVVSQKDYAELESERGVLERKHLRSGLRRYDDIYFNDENLIVQLSFSCGECEWEFHYYGEKNVADTVSE